MKLRVLETALYVDNLDASEKFYAALFGCETLLNDEPEIESARSEVSTVD